MEHAVEARRDARFRQHVAHKDEERHGNQRIPVQHLEGGVERHLEGALAPQPQRRRRVDEADHAEDALAGEQQHQHGAEHEKGDGFGTHAIGFPRAMAMSLMKVEMSCSSIRKMPAVITDLIGHSGGPQAV